MASKLAAAKIAAWSGVRSVIAAATVDNVIVGALEQRAGIGTVVQARPHRLPARKLWIAFAQGAHGRVIVDAGARGALIGSGKSLLPAGIVGVEGDFGVDDAVEVVGPDGVVFAKGLVRVTSDAAKAMAGKHTTELPEGIPHELIHRDDLVVLPA